MNQKNIRIFVFFVIIILWGYFSFPIEILKIQDPSGVVSYGYTENAKAYLKSYLITL
ncbi:amino acid ABC transporter permease, partial [Campylobacter jejuni]|nr:amino acid ABC transporter permease [Campylobacter jejuni]